MESTTTEPMTVERIGDIALVRFNWLGAPIGLHLSTTEVLWRFLELEKIQPSKILLVFFPPELVGPGSLEMLSAADAPGEGPQTTRIAPQRFRKMVREESLLRRWVETIRELPTYVVGVIQGEVALRRLAPYLACDFRIASDDTVLINTIQQLPVVPAAGVPWFLARFLGPARASQLLLELPKVSAQQARGFGLVNYLSPPETLETKALEVAQKYAAMPRSALVGVKRAMVASCEDLSRYLDRELEVVRELSVSD